MSMSEKQDIQRKKLNAHVYKQMFRNARRKVKALNEVNDVNVKESCTGSERKKRRLVLDSGEGGVCFGNQEHANELSRVSPMDGEACETLLKMDKLVDIQHGLCTKIKIESGVHSELSEFPFKVSSEVRNNVLPYVNKLRDYWHRGHDAVIFDELDRLHKVVFFVLLLLDKEKQPVLVIAATSVVSLWEAEFSKWSKLINVVTYKGNKDNRTAIRASGFYDEKGSIKFPVLLSSPDFLVEDWEMLNHIKWELIVIDECQRYSISMHSKKLKRLVSDMKLLTVTDEVVDKKDIRERYQYILSMLDSKRDKGTDDDTQTLKERLTPFIAFECKFSTTEIKEYWVPVHLSSTQIEQYCSILDSKKKTLSTRTKKISSVHNILSQIRKCCDHPYLVDPTLRDSSETDASIDPLGADIEFSGKLQMLDKLLLEIKRSGLRVLVLFQRPDITENVSIGDILEDFVHKKFGEDSYVRIQGRVSTKEARRKRKKRLQIFNCVENGTFVCLFDYHRLHSSLPLSHVNVAILFNSDWNPSYDIGALQRITFDPHCSKPLRVFRLYSSFTVEEKTLIFAKQGAPLESHIHQLNWTISLTTCHQLLAWGASYLFSKLQSQTNSTDTSSDLVREFSSLLTNKSDETGPTNCSTAELRDGSYAKSILLLGETEAHTKESSSTNEDLILKKPSVFWTNLLKKSSSKLSRNVHKSAQNSCHLFKSLKRKARSKRKTHKSGHIPWAEVRLHVGGHQTSTEISPTLDQGEIQRDPPSSNLTNAQLPPAPSTSTSEPLEAESERIQKEQEQVKKLHHEKKSMLHAECEKELSEVRKKYDAIINESETCLTKELKIHEDYHALVDANKLLAKIFAQKWNDSLNLKGTENGTLLRTHAESKNVVSSN